MNDDLSNLMKIAPPRPILTCVAVVPDQVQFDCPACDTTHWLTRGLDFNENADGVWALKEAPGFECDCGALICADFRLTIERTV